jgi:hypothetical protein
LNPTPAGRDGVINPQDLLRKGDACIAPTLVHQELFNQKLYRFPFIQPQAVNGGYLLRGTSNKNLLTLQLPCSGKAYSSTFLKMLDQFDSLFFCNAG